MKPIRVSISATIVAIVLGFIFFVPLPVTQIRERGFVQVLPTEIAQVSVEVPGILKVMHVKEGQAVKKGNRLAEFENYELEKQRDLVVDQMEAKLKVVRAYDEQINKEQDAQQKANMREQRAKADGEYRQAVTGYNHVILEIKKLTLFAPRDGVVIGLPSIDEVGKGWDREQNTVFCSIGDKTKLRVLVPLSPADYALLQENKGKATPQRPLLATIRVQGHGSKTWPGKITQLPKSDAKDVPWQLTTKAGGPLAIKPTSSQNQLVPQSQVYLVGIDFEKPDDSIAINSAAQVKIHCEYRSCAWWIYRTVATTFDIGLVMKW